MNCNDELHDILKVSGNICCPFCDKRLSECDESDDEKLEDCSIKDLCCDESDCESDSQCDCDESECSVKHNCCDCQEIICDDGMLVCRGCGCS